MKKHRKRGLAWLLTLCMLVSMVLVPTGGLTAFAEGEGDSSKDQVVEPIKVTDDEQEPAEMTEEEEYALESNASFHDESTSEAPMRMMAARSIISEVTFNPSPGTHFYAGETVPVSPTNIKGKTYGYWTKVNNVLQNILPIMKKNGEAIELKSTRGVPTDYFVQVSDVGFMYAAYGSGHYYADLPPAVSKLELEDRTKRSVSIKWPAMPTALGYNVYLETNGGLELLTEKPITDTKFTFDNFKSDGDSISVAVTAIYTGIYDKTVTLESPEKKGTFKAADFAITGKTEVLAKGNLRDKEIGGTIKPEFGYGDIGTPYRLEATADIGYKFVEWAERDTVKDAGLEDSDVSAALAASAPSKVKEELFTADTDVTARFAREMYTVTVNPQTVAQPTNHGGDVQSAVADEYGYRAPETDSYEFKTVLNLTATPKAGYQFKEWLANGVAFSTSETANYEIVGNTAIIGVFEKEPVGLEAFTIKLMNGETKTDLFKGDVEKEQYSARAKDEVPFGTTMKELVYDTTVKAKANNGVQFKNFLGENSFVSSADLPQSTSLNGTTRFNIRNISSMMLIYNEDGTLVDPESKAVSGNYIVKFRIFHNSDGDFDSWTKAKNPLGGIYHNAVRNYTLNLHIKVLDPALNLTVQEGGKVKIIKYQELDNGSESESIEMASAQIEAKKVRPYGWKNGYFQGTLYYPLNDGTPQTLMLIPQSYDADQYKFAGWLVNGKTVSGIELKHAMDNNYTIEAKFEKVMYTLKPCEDLANGKIQYRAYENAPDAASLDVDAKDSNSSKWADLPSTGKEFPYGTRIKLRAVPNEGFLFGYWKHPSMMAPKPVFDIPGEFGESTMMASDFKKKKDVPYPTTTLTLFAGLDDFGKKHELSTCAVFVPDYGFKTYSIPGINDGQDLLAKNSSFDKMRDDREYPSKIRTVNVEMNVPYGTTPGGPTPDQVMAQAQFSPIHTLVNPENGVWLLNQAGGLTGMNNAKQVTTGYTIKNSADFTAFKKLKTKSNEIKFLYSTIVSQYAQPLKSKDPSPRELAAAETEKSKVPFQIYGEWIQYDFVVTVNVDKPVLNINVPIGGKVIVESTPVDTETIRPMIVAPTPQKVEKVEYAPGTYHVHYNQATQLTITSTVDSGYRNDGWVSLTGFTVVPANGHLGMDKDMTIQPIFTLPASTTGGGGTATGRDRADRATQLAQIVNEETPLGALFSTLFIGHQTGELKLNDNITRGQLALVLSRALKYDLTTVPSIPVIDRNKMAVWYEKQAMITLGKGYMKLKGNNEFRGQDLVTGSELIETLTLAFGKQGALDIIQANKLASMVSMEQMSKIVRSNAPDFRFTSDEQTPRGSAIAANGPVSRQLVARMIFALMYPTTPVAPAAAEKK